MSIFQYVNISIFQYFNMSIFQYVIFSICQYFNMSIFQYANISIWQYFNMAILHYVNITICHYFNMSIFQYGNISIFQYFNISIFQYFIVSIFQYINIIICQYLFELIFQYFNISMCQYVNISICQYVNVSIFHGWDITQTCLAMQCHWSRHGPDMVQTWLRHYSWLTVLGLASGGSFAKGPSSNISNSMWISRQDSGRWTWEKCNTLNQTKNILFLLPYLLVKRNNRLSSSYLFLYISWQYFMTNNHTKVVVNLLQTMWNVPPMKKAL